MGAVYGEMLCSFPELLRDYEVFVMRPKVSGGFEPREPYKKVRAYLVRDTGGNFEIAPDGNAVAGQEAKFFMFDRLPAGLIRQGMYVEDDGELFKFRHDDGFAREGGFAVHKLVIVAGPNGEQVVNERVEDNFLNAY